MLYYDSTSKVHFYFLLFFPILLSFIIVRIPLMAFPNPIAPIVLLSITNVHPAVFLILLLIVFFKFHHAATQNPDVYGPKQNSPCGNSISWSRHQICDTSFFYITIKALLKVKFCTCDLLF